MRKAVTQCIFLLAFTALTNDCSFLWPPEPEPEEVTFKESCLLHPQAEGPCVSSAKLRPALAPTPGPPSRVAGLGKTWKTGIWGKGLLWGPGEDYPTPPCSGEVGQGAFQPGALWARLSVLECPASRSAWTCRCIPHTFWKPCP